MIKTQALREPQAPAQPCRADFVFEEKPKGNFVPLAFLTVLTGFAVYLKSFLSVAREAPPRHENNRAHNPESDSAQGQTLGEEGPAMVAAPETPERDDAAGSSDDRPPAGPRRAVSGELLDELAGSRAQPHTNSQLYVGPGTRPGQHPANDNQSAIKPPSTEADGASRGGGGGGGGAAETTVRQLVDRVPPRDEVRNRLPRTTGPVILPDLIACQAYFIPFLVLLAGASDPDGDPLKVLDLTSASGKVTAVDGGWMFTPERGGLRDVVFKYSISDGIGHVQQVAHLRIVDAPPIIGTDGDDNLLGTACGDVIDARAGDDNLDAREGNDVVIAGDGNDHIVAGAGDDIVFAGNGADVVFAGAGNDVVHGGEGNDRLFGEAGDDTLLGEAGDDLIAGGDGDDILVAGSGNDTLQGDAGNDTLDGGDGDDEILGGDGSDVILAGAGNDKVAADAGDDAVFGGDGDDILADGHGYDTIEGGSGGDHVIAAADAVADRYDGSSGEDTLDYSSAVLDIFVNIREGSAEGADIGRDFIANFEKIIGGQGDDYFVGGAGPISLTGGDGDDTFEFKRSDDDHQPDLVHKITDFTNGDRIIAARYEIFYRQEEGAEPEIGDLFEDIYLAENSDQRPIRFRFEQGDGSDFTFVDIHDRGDSEEYYSIELPGRHDLEFIVVVS
jgi:hypothetical protein